MNYCEGCLSYTYYISERRTLICALMEYNDKGQCPCYNCIVKVMCQDTCDVFMRFRNNAVTKGANTNV
jgi:hypothetical protein